MDVQADRAIMVAGIFILRFAGEAALGPRMDIVTAKAKHPSHQKPMQCHPNFFSFDKIPPFMAKDAITNNITSIDIAIDPLSCLLSDTKGKSH